MGAQSGWTRGGLIGAIVGGLIGGVLFVIAARVTMLMILGMASLGFRKRSVQDMQSQLRDPSCLAPNLVLHELRRRDAVSAEDLTAVFDMLVDESVERRGRGWAALCSVYPELSAKIPEYSIEPITDNARAAVARLRSEYGSGTTQQS